MSIPIAGHEDEHYDQAAHDNKSDEEPRLLVAQKFSPFATLASLELLPAIQLAHGDYHEQHGEIYTGKELEDDGDVFYRGVVEVC